MKYLTSLVCSVFVILSVNAQEVTELYFPTYGNSPLNDSFEQSFTAYKNVKILSGLFGSSQWFPQIQSLPKGVYKLEDLSDYHKSVIDSYLENLDYSKISYFTTVEINFNSSKYYINNPIVCEEGIDSLYLVKDYIRDSLYTFDFYEGDSLVRKSSKVNFKDTVDCISKYFYYTVDTLSGSNNTLSNFVNVYLNNIDFGFKETLVRIDTLRFLYFNEYGYCEIFTRYDSLYRVEPLLVKEKVILNEQTEISYDVVYLKAQLKYKYFIHDDSHTELTGTLTKKVKALVDSLNNNYPYNSYKNLKYDGGAIYLDSIQRVKEDWIYPYGLRKVVASSGKIYYLYEFTDSIIHTARYYGYLGNFRFPLDYFPGTEDCYKIHGENYMKCPNYVYLIDTAELKDIVLKKYEPDPFNPKSDDIEFVPNLLSDEDLYKFYDVKGGLFKYNDSYFYMNYIYKSYININLYNWYLDYTGKQVSIEIQGWSDFLLDRKVTYIPISYIYNVMDTAYYGYYLENLGFLYNHFSEYGVPNWCTPLQSLIDLYETKYGDSIPGDSIPGDSIPGDSIPGDSIPGDSIPGDSIPGDSIPGDSIPGDSIPGDSIPGDSIPGDSERVIKFIEFPNYGDFVYDLQGRKIQFTSFLKGVFVYKGRKIFL